jgi:hypothetical protein
MILLFLWYLLFWDLFSFLVIFKCREADENSNVISNSVTELEETENLAPAKLNNCVDSLGPEPYVDPSNGGVHAQTLSGLYSHGAEDYNQLLGQFYELEEKRQKILQQLNLHGGYNYQYPAEGSGSGGYWGTCSASQDQSVAATQASLSPLICSCCPYACHCSVAPCSSFSSCTFGGTSLGKACTDSSAMMNPGKSFPPIDDDIVKTAMNAAERAISSMTMNTPVVNSDIEGKHGFLKMIKMSIKKRNVLEFNQNFVDNMTVLSSRL